MAELNLSQIKKSFGSVDVLKGIDLHIAEGEFVSLLGPSGCGKSTLLRIIAGLESTTEGVISIAGRDVTRAAPEHRDVALMFQSYALFPHMTVFDNVRFPLRMKGNMAKADQKDRIMEALSLVQMDSFADRFPKQLSGGQQQRVALARAIVGAPKVLLLDEPLSNLDAKLRDDMQVQLKQLHERLKLTTVFVTHDQSEALGLSDKVVLMNRGHIEQEDSPKAIYSRPKTVFAADFIGAANIIRADLKEQAAGQWTATLPNEDVVAVNAPEDNKGGARHYMVRQEAIQLNPPAADGLVTTRAALETQVYLGNFTRSVIRLGDTALNVQGKPLQANPEDGPLTVGWHKDDMLLLND